MAKIARRSVASNPSSLTSSTLSSLPSSRILSSSSFITTGGNSYQKRSSLTNSNINSYSSSSSSSSLSSSLSANQDDPLRATNYQFTTRTIPNYNRNGNTTATHSNSSMRRNDNKNFNNLNSNNTPSQSSTPSTTNQDYNYNSTLSAADILAAEREKIRMEFYATYDVMTGVRIAATLGGFFGLMVFLVIYKSRGHSDETLKVLKDPKIAAVAAACMQEEEEREIQEAIEATGLSIYPDEYDNIMFRRQRMLSIGNVSAPPILHRNYRFSSLGGGAYSSLMESGRRYSYSYGRRRSGSESSRILGSYQLGGSFGTNDYFIETDDELEKEYDQLQTRKIREGSIQQQTLLDVPPTGSESRRSSAMTCCSTESSYLERRCSALNLGLMELPTTLQRRISSVSRRSSGDIWDYYYPDIQIIQATPKTSPCLSERTVHDKTKNSSAPSNTYTKLSSSQIPTTANGTTLPTNYCGQNNKIFPKSDASYQLFDNFVEKRKICHTLSADNYDKNQKISSLNRKYDDNNELKLTVKRNISDPSNVINNNNSYSNIYTSSCDSLQLFRNNGNNDAKRAPLASLSSFKISSIDCQDSDLKSLGSDSVFVESYADTDDDMEQFSTDSDELSGSLCDDNEQIQPPLSSTSLQQIKISPSSLLLQQHQEQTKLSDSNQMEHQHISTISDLCPLKKSDDYKKSICSSSTGGIKKSRLVLGRHRTTSEPLNDRILLISSSQQSSQEHPLEPQELPNYVYSCYMPSTSSITCQLPKSKTSDIISSSLLDEPTTSTVASIETGTEAFSSCSSSHKTEIHRPHHQSTILFPLTKGKRIRSSNNYNDNNNDSFNKNNRGSVSSSSSSSKRYLSKNRRYQDNLNDDNVNENLDVDDDDDDHINGGNNKEDKSKLCSSSSKNSNNECVEVNVIIENRPTTNLIDSSVILELPVITIPSQVEDDPPRDPSLPGTSRKWSKETLF